MLAHDILKTMNIEEAKKSLQEDGCYLIENAFEKSFCDRVISFIENHKADEKTEYLYQGTEVRIWDSQRRDPELGSYFDFSNRLVQPFLENGAAPSTLLAIRNHALGSHQRDLALGRWHIDSFREQIKLFLFLNDTRVESGAFEFIPKTHHPIFKWKMICTGHYFRPRDFISGKRAYQRFDESFMEEMFAKGYCPKPVICRAGTLMIVNTSAIHRARPCYEGSRYALTTYYL